MFVGIFFAWQEALCFCNCDVKNLFMLDGFSLWAPWWARRKNHRQTWHQTGCQHPHFTAAYKKEENKDMHEQCGFLFLCLVSSQLLTCLWYENISHVHQCFQAPSWDHSNNRFHCIAAGKRLSSFACSRSFLKQNQWPLIDTSAFLSSLHAHPQHTWKMQQDLLTCGYIRESRRCEILFCIY